MRVSSLSDERVIALITKYFVPAWVSRDSYQLDAPGKAEQEELQRLDRDRRKRGLEGGTVCVFIIDPDGGVIATQRVQLACKPENLVPFLEKIIADRRLEPRSSEAVRASAARPSQAAPKTEGGVILHVWTRCLTETNRGVSQDRVELAPDEWKAFLPPADARAGASWQIPEKVARKLYQYCYPPGPHWAARDCKVLGGSLKATLIEVSGQEARLRLEGRLELRFPATDKPTDGKVTAKLVGAARCNLTRKALTSLALVSEEADYVWYWQGQPQPLKMRIAVALENPAN